VIKIKEGTREFYFNGSENHKLMDTKGAMCHEKQRVFRCKGRGTQKAVSVTRGRDHDR